MFDSLNKYLEATQDHLGVEGERYGGGFRAIVAHRSATDFLFGMLEGSDLEGTEAQAFLGENPLFPSAWGKTPLEALQKLDAKLGILYRFEPTPKRAYTWEAHPQFELKAQYDAEPSEVQTWYDVRWLEVVQDLQSDSIYYYEYSKEHCGLREKRDLHALLNFKYEGEFAHLANLT